jgi:hypothetical protein
MGIATFPASSGGLTSAIKSIQRGIASGEGSISISSVDTTKTMCNSFSTSSAGSVAASGTVASTSGTASATSTSSATITSKIGQRDSTVSYGQGTINATAYNWRCNWNNNEIYFTNNSSSLAAQNIGAQNLSINSAAISGGSTSLTSAVYGVYLTSSTAIYATGPCRYEVIEHY